jgi:hypothetical protein
VHPLRTWDSRPSRSAPGPEDAPQGPLNRVLASRRPNGATEVHLQGVAPTPAKVEPVFDAAKATVSMQGFLAWGV